MSELRSWPRCRGLFISVLVLAGSAGLAQAQQGKPGGGGHTEAATNNLSYPAVHTVDPGTVPVWNVPVGILGTDYSFGCKKPETIGTTTYPNTSCVDAAGAALTADACTTEGGKCAGLPLNRIYWQKVNNNDWWAESMGTAGSQRPSYLDWGDSIESVTWKTTSNIRVETTPYTSVPEAMLGFEMWHVFGQGPDEQWGVRATDDTEPLLPYIYRSTIAIIHTPTAHLNIAKLEQGASPCPVSAPPGGSGFVLPWTGSSWTGAKQLRDITYTAELNVGGRYVYGYNWMLRRDQVEPWSKAGWWRLTFYTPDGSTLFDNLDIPKGPPEGIPGEPGPVMLVAEAETGPLYAPVIDVMNNLTYIDICIAEGGSGSGGGGGGKGGGGGH